ncbi:MAG: hypothetical protein DMF89_15720 [Acidobacteria bacterium]|nr:MAG: hypothetical protein DMF89_15720 [Acidobacteriota bacterium]
MGSNAKPLNHSRDRPGLPQVFVDAIEELGRDVDAYRRTFQTPKEYPKELFHFTGDHRIPCAHL